MEFLRKTAAMMFNSASRVLNVFTLEGIGRLGVIWNSWPSTRRPARCRLKAFGFQYDMMVMFFFVFVEILCSQYLG